MNEFIEKRVLQQLRSHPETITCLKLTDNTFMDREREIAIDYLSQHVDRIALTESHSKFLKGVKMRLVFFSKFLRLTVEERKIFTKSVAEYAKEMNLYNIIMNEAPSFNASLEHIIEFEGDITFDDLKLYTEKELEILSELIADL